MILRKNWKRIKLKLLNYKKKNAQLEKDNKELKYLLNKSNQQNLKKDILLDKLNKQIENKNLLLEKCQNDVSENNNIENESSRKESCQNELLFKQFEGKINEDDLTRLRSLSDDKHKDSTFVLRCLEILYNENLAVLCEKRAKSTNTKQALSPEKRVMIENLFTERLKSINLSAQDHSARIVRFRTILSSGLSNIKKKSIQRTKKQKKEIHHHRQPQT